MGASRSPQQFWFVDNLTPNKRKRDENSHNLSKARAHAAKASLRNRYGPIASPTSLLGGNSDPFHSLPIRVTPRIASAIKFRNVHYVPSCSYSCHPTWSVSKGTHYTMDIAIHKECLQLSRPFTAPAFALYLVTIQGQLLDKDRCWKDETTKLKIDAFSSLRKDLVRRMPQEVACTILWLFAEAVMSANLKEALTHGHAFKNLFISMRSNGRKVASPDITTALWLDSHLSMMFMRRTIFDPELVADDMQIYSHYLNRTQPICNSFDASLPEFLQSGITQLRTTCKIWRAADVPIAKCDTRMLVQQLTVHSHVRKIKLINYYLDNSQSIIGSLTLALLCLELSQGCDPAFGGKRLLPSTALIMSHLYASMQDRLQPGHAELWCLYVGAYMEDREAPGLKSTWFKRAFASLASSMHLSTNDVIRVLQGFLHVCVVDPLGHSWLEETLNAGCEDHEPPLMVEIPSWVQLNETHVEASQVIELECD